MEVTEENLKMDVVDDHNMVIDHEYKAQIRIEQLTLLLLQFRASTTQQTPRASSSSLAVALQLGLLGLCSVAGLKWLKSKMDHSLNFASCDEFDKESYNVARLESKLRAGLQLWRYASLLKSRSKHISLQENLRKLQAAKSSSFIVVDGPPQCGKTTTLRAFCLAKMREGNPAIYFDFRKIIVERSIEDYLVVLPVMIIRLAEGYALEGKSLTIAIDGFDSFDGYAGSFHKKKVLQALEQTLQHNAKVYFTCADSNFQMEIASHIPTVRFDNIHLRPFNQGDLQNWITQRLVDSKRHHLEGNSVADINTYCEVVGNITELRVHNFDQPEGLSVKAITGITFESTVRSTYNTLDRIRHSNDEMKKCIKQLCETQVVQQEKDWYGSEYYDRLLDDKLVRLVNESPRQYEFANVGVEMAFRTLFGFPKQNGGESQQALEALCKEHPAILKYKEAIQKKYYRE